MTGRPPATRRSGRNWHSTPAAVAAGAPDRRTAFPGSGPEHHATICQIGKVGVALGRWYPLSFRARAEGIQAGSVQLGLVSMRPWQDAGLADAFLSGARWQRYEFLFQARQDVPAPTSRLQFWFLSTGTLWLDDVSLVESTEELLKEYAWYSQTTSDEGCAREDC